MLETTVKLCARPIEASMGSRQSTPVGSKPPNLDSLLIYRDTDVVRCRGMAPARTDLLSCSFVVSWTTWTGLAPRTTNRLSRTSSERESRPPASSKSTSPSRTSISSENFFFSFLGRFRAWPVPFRSFRERDRNGFVSELFSQLDLVVIIRRIIQSQSVIHLLNKRSDQPVWRRLSFFSSKNKTTFS